MAAAPAITNHALVRWRERIDPDGLGSDVEAAALAALEVPADLLPYFRVQGDSGLLWAPSVPGGGALLVTRGKPLRVVTVVRPWGPGARTLLERRVGRAA